MDDTYKNGMPKSLRIGSTVVKITRRTEEEDTDLTGSNAYYIINSERIVIRKGLNKHQAKSILLHEILHAIRWHTGGTKYLDEVMKEKKKVGIEEWEHYFIDLFDKPMVQLLRDNPHLVKYLTGR